MMKNTEKTLEKLVSLSKTRGFVFPGSEIYGGLAKRLGERNLSRRTNTMSVLTAQFL